MLKTGIKHHQAQIVPGSIKKSAVGGVEFVVRCCGKHEKSVHIQHPGKHSQAELLRIRDEHLAEVAQEHANHDAAVAFLAQHANLTTETLSHGEDRTQSTATDQRTDDCGCGAEAIRGTPQAEARAKATPFTTDFH